MEHAQPVIVIGNGPVGQTAALLLARRNVPVLLIDSRARRETGGSKAICQQRDVLDVWDSVGAGQQIADEGVTWSYARTFYRDSELFGYGFQDGGSSPFPPFVNISQSRTEWLLDRQIEKQPLIEVHWDCTASAISQDSSGVRVTCRNASGPASLDGSHAVVCTGARGDAIRRDLGISFDGHTFDDQFLICDIRCELPDWAAERRFYFDPPWNPGRQVLIHPCPDSSFRIDWQVPEDYDLRTDMASGRLDRRIRSIIGARPYELLWHSVYRFHSRIVDRMRIGRVLLAGDAAHLVAPFGARGLNSGVLDADNLAWKIAYVRNGWAPAGLLESYHTERHAAALENLSITSATMRFLAPQTGDEREHRLDVLRRAGTDATARALVDSGRLAEPYWYGDSPLTTPDPRHPCGGRPPRGHDPRPGPGVIVPDYPLRHASEPLGTRLRSLVRAGVTALLGAAVDVRSAQQVLAKAPVPVAAHPMADLAPDLHTLLGAEPDEIWLVRPDAHVAAVVDLAQLEPAVHRMLGRSAAQLSRR